MRRLVLKMSMSLDGFVAGPAGEIDWIFRNRDEGSTAWNLDTIGRAGLHAMGRVTYDAMAAYWPGSTDALADPMNRIPKVVFTNRPAAELASWSGTEVASGDLAAEIDRLKRQPGGDILAHGGAGFARSLMRLGLIDELRLLVHPVALGRGLPLFSELRAPAELRLLDSAVFRSGVTAKVYRPADPVRTT